MKTERKARKEEEEKGGEDTRIRIKAKVCKKRRRKYEKEEEIRDKGCKRSRRKKNLELIQIGGKRKEMIRE